MVTKSAGSLYFFSCSFLRQAARECALQVIFFFQLLSQAAWERTLLLALAAAFIFAERGAQKVRAAVQV